MENHKPLPTRASMNPLFPAMLVLALMLLLSSCSNPLSRTGNAGTRTPLIEQNLDVSSITRIQIVPDYNGNPRGSNPAKEITEPQEIAALVSAFQNAYLGEAMDLIYGNASVFRFFTSSGLSHQFSFSTAPGHPAYTGNACAASVFEGEDPWALYERATAAVYTVDQNFNPTLALPLTASHLQVQTVTSRFLKQDMKVSVYLPSGYDIYGQYPVLYMLHGYTGDETSWMPGLSLHDTADTLIAEGVISPLIIVAPNIDNSYGINSADEPAQLGSSPDNSLNEGLYEDYLIDELIPWVDDTYYTLRERDGRSIGGLSMGGCAALHLVFSYPEMFSRVSGHSPALFIDDLPMGLGNWLYPTEKLRAERDPLQQAATADLSGLSVWLDCGDADSYRFYEGCELLEKVLQDREVSVEYHLNPGLHDGEYWRTHAREYLLFHAGVE